MDAPFSLSIVGHVAEIDGPTAAGGLREVVREQWEERQAAADYAAAQFGVSVKGRLVLV